MNKLSASSSSFKDNLKTAVSMLRERQYDRVASGIAHCVHQRWTAIGLKRELSKDHAPPRAGIEIEVRPYQSGDFDALFANVERLPHSERLEFKSRQALLESQIPTCYVAVDKENGRPCYMQWLIAATHNAQIQSFFKGRFPVLASNEALLENAYTPPAYRGRGIMPAAMSMIAEQACDLGADAVVTFVLEENVPSLKGCRKAGFLPYLVRTDRHVMLRTIRTRRFEPYAPSAVRDPSSAIFSVT